MKLLHTSDWHLGRVLHERSLLDDQSVFLDQLIEILRSDPHDALLISGDIFDRGIPPEEAVERFSLFLRDLRVACPKLPVILIAGNHDSAARLAYGAALFAVAGVHVRSATHAIEEPVRLRGADGTEAEIWTVPFLWPGSLSVHRDGEETPLGTQVDALEEAVRRVRACRSPKRNMLQVLMAHCFAAGSQVSDSERALVGYATQVTTTLFAGFDYVALGHLHRSQQVGERVWYSGSPLKYSFSEAGDAKSVLSVTLAPRTSPTVIKVPIVPLRDLAILRGRFRDLLENPAHLEMANCYLRVELDESERIAQPVVLLRQRYPFLLDFRMPDAATDEASRGAQAAGPRGRHDRPDVERDFLDFERRLRGEASLPEGMLEAFRRLRARADREVDKNGEIGSTS